MEIPSVLQQVLQCIVGTWTVLGVVLCVMAINTAVFLPARFLLRWNISSAILELALLIRLDLESEVPSRRVRATIVLAATWVGMLIGYWAVGLLNLGVLFLFTVLVLVGAVRGRQEALKKAFEV